MNIAVSNDKHYSALDGWRGASILLVMAAHLFPLGPKSLRMNEAIAAMGMVLFFTLSGFLITSFLLKHDSVGSFLIRRFFRIVPLAWLCCGLVLVIYAQPLNVWLAHGFFYANLPPYFLLPVTGHIWSLCLEVQFYVGIALLVATLGVRRLTVLPLLCVAVTIARIVADVEISIVTWYRIDEILAGCTLALILNLKPASTVARAVGKTPPLLLLGALLVACHPHGGPMNYLRPYLASALVGTTLFNRDGWLGRWLHNRTLAYIAGVSYALYVLHPLLAATWLGTGDTMVKYAKRPLLLAVLFGLAQLSTQQFEARWIELGRNLSNKWTTRRARA